MNPSWNPQMGRAVLDSDPEYDNLRCYKHVSIFQHLPTHEAGWSFHFEEVMNKNFHLPAISCSSLPAQLLHPATVPSSSFSFSLESEWEGTGVQLTSFFRISAGDCGGWTEGGLRVYWGGVGTVLLPGSSWPGKYWGSAVEVRTKRGGDGDGEAGCIKGEWMLLRVLIQLGLFCKVVKVMKVLFNFWKLSTLSV